jgi:hypothetical protein
VAMLQKALSYFRSRLYHLRQQKELSPEKAMELEKSQYLLKALNRTMRDESLRKIQDLKLHGLPSEPDHHVEEKHGYNRQPIGLHRKNSDSSKNTHM